MDKFYRIKVILQEPHKLSAGFRSQFKKELADNTLYLGIRFSPTNFDRSAAINSLGLAYQCISLFENSTTEYGPAICYVEECPCLNEFMQSIIETDSRTMEGYVHRLGNSYKVKILPEKKKRKIRMWPF